VTRNSKEKSKNVNRKRPTEPEPGARSCQRQAPAKRQPGAITAHRQAVPGCRRAVDEIFGPCLMASAGQ